MSNTYDRNHIGISKKGCVTPDDPPIAAGQPVQESLTPQAKLKSDDNC